TADMHSAVMLEINSETDFVARDEHFIGFSDKVVATALSSAVTGVTDLSAEALAGSGLTVEQARQELVAKIGENIQVRRMERLHSEGVIGSYLHGSRIGVLVAMKNKDEELARDIAMHIAASRPMVVSPEQVSAEAIENERDIFTAQARESG